MAEPPTNDTLRITTNKSNANVKSYTDRGHQVYTFLYFSMQGDAVWSQGQQARWFTDAVF